MFWIDIEYLIFQFIKLKIWFSGKDIFLLYKNKSLEQFNTYTLKNKGVSLLLLLLLLLLL